MQYTKDRYANTKKISEKNILHIITIKPD